MSSEGGQQLGSNRWWRVLAFTVVNIAAGIAAGLIVLSLTRPSQDQLQRAALDEVGLPMELERAPFLGPALDTYTERIAARVVAESKPSAAAALGAGVAVAIVSSLATSAVAARDRIRVGSIGRRGVDQDSAEEEGE